MTVTVTYDDGHSHLFEDIATWDIYDRNDIENIAGRELTDEEFSDIKLELEYVSELTGDNVRKVVYDYLNNNGD